MRGIGEAMKKFMGFDFLDAIMGDGAAFWPPRHNLLCEYNLPLYVDTFVILIYQADLNAPRYQDGTRCAEETKIPKGSAASITRW